MIKKQQPPKPAAQTTDNLTGWGGKVVQSRVPSGIKIRMTPDADMILKYLGSRDITENLTEVQQKINEASGKKAIVLAFHDGKNFVSISAGYATSGVHWKQDTWYYIHNQGEVESSREGHQPMKDLLILELGLDGEQLQCPPRISDDGILTLNPKGIAELNYGRLNYPLRTS